MIELRNGQALMVGQKVRVYRNLHKGLFSIQDYGSKKVIGYGENFLLKNVDFNVSQAGRNRVVTSKKKNVHAFIEGLYSGVIYTIPSTAERIYYNPYITQEFVIENTLREIIYSDNCFFFKGRCYIS